MSKRIVRKFVFRLTEALNIYFIYKIPKLFELKIKQKKKNAVIIMKILTNTAYTKEYPLTLDILKKTLPSVLKSECFNEENLPFYQEVEDTELGHLFEHILLEYLCILKLSKGCNSSSYSGHTKWDWNIEPHGTFNIIINATCEDMDIFPKAIEKSINLFITIITFGSEKNLHTNSLFLNTYN